MWDETPDTDLLNELPEEYTFETALADLIVSVFGTAQRRWNHCVLNLFSFRYLHASDHIPG